MSTSIRKSLAFAGAAAGAALLMSSSSAFGAQRIFTVGPTPSDPTTIEAQLKRFIGQTDFLNPYTRFSGERDAMPAPKAGQKSESSAQRAQQESDVFKIGKPGSKLLYLLNNYRGLQVVSFAQGAARPELVGRVAPTGNWPSDMYYDETRERLLVLERAQADDNVDSFGYTSKSRVVVYDVKDPAHPAITQQVEIEGDVADSRIVGNVLYVATSTHSYYPSAKANTNKGAVYSLSLKGAEVQVIQSHQLHLPASYGENMNIVEIQEGGKYKYYLLAILSESGWGWWDRKSLVEVVDISDENGQIQPGMVVSAKGMVRERSQTSIKNKTLIVASNYTPEGGVARIAVETFKLPTSKDEVIDENEAQYRKLHLDRELKGHTQDEQDELYKKLVSDPQLGIQGRFVRGQDGSLKKIIADSAITVGDTQGLHANLQDVRFNGDKLYVFWVPSNNQDPFDLFDISAPEKEVKWLGRLYFEGWIERAFPMSFQGKEYVLGLGYTIPPVDNEHQKRHPQAMLFEIQNKNGKVKHRVVDDLTLEKSNTWTDFNRGDKYVELRSNADGTGQILFRASTYDKGKYLDGGKLIGFDLRKAADEAGVFTEGAMLTGDSSWVRRVFNNPEIRKVNTFSDKALGTYDVTGTGRAGEVKDAMSILELARDVAGYAQIGHTGVQIIRDGYRWDSGSGTLLRRVDPARADAEKSQVSQELKLKGSYSTHFVARDGQSMWIATQEYTSDGNSSHTVHHIYQVSDIKTEGGLKIVAQSSWTADTQYQLPEAGKRYSITGESRFVERDAAKRGMLYLTGEEMYDIALTEGGTLKANRIELENCLTPDGQYEYARVSQHSTTQGNAFVYSFHKLIQDPEQPKLYYRKNFAAPLTLSGAKATCGAAINIPGTVMSYSQGHIVTQDDRYVDRVARKYKDNEGKETVYYEIISERALASLKLDAGKASLIDDYELSSKGWFPQFLEVGGGRLGIIDYNESDSGGGWRSEALARLTSMPMPPYRRTVRTNPRFVVLGFGNDLRFTKEQFAMSESFPKNAQLVQVAKDPAAPGSYLGVVRGSGTVQVLKWTDQDRRPVPQKIAAVDESFRLKSPAETVQLAGWTSGVNFSPDRRTFELSLGDFGIQQIQLAE